VVADVLPLTEAAVVAVVSSVETQADPKPSISSRSKEKNKLSSKHKLSYQYS